MKNQIILTGPMGSGKSTVIDILKANGITTVPEPARKILAEQRAINGNGVPEKDPKLFCQLMLSRAIDDYHRYKASKNLVIYDRGIPDNKVYADLFKLNLPEINKASEIFKYHKTIFFLPSWQEIYCTDEERKMTYEQAAVFGDALKAYYQDLGYELCELPKDTPETRTQIIIDYIIAQNGI